MRSYCPYCKADLRVLSAHVVGIGFAANCPFCKKKIYGTLGEDGLVSWDRFNLLKLIMISVVGVIILTLIAFLILK